MYCVTIKLFYNDICSQAFSYISEYWFLNRSIVILTEAENGLLCALKSNK